jgi:hypothetical protein
VHRVSAIVTGAASGLVAVLALLASLGCCNTRTIMQSGLVPLSEPDPPPSSHGSGDLYASGTALTHLESTGDASSGGYVPAGQIHVGGMLRPIAGLMIRPMGVLAFADGAGAMGTGTAPTGMGTALAPLTPPRTASFAAGVSFGYMLGDEDDVYVLHPHVGIYGVGIQAMVSDPAGIPAEAHYAGMAMVAGGLDIGIWAAPWLLLMASADVRNLPSVPSSVTACVGDSPPFVGFGDATLTMRLSGEVVIAPGVSLFGGIAFPTVGVTYQAWPILTGGIRGTFGDGRDGLRRRRDPPPENDPDRPAWGSRAGAG